jgi:hypothetical protein
MKIGTLPRALSRVARIERSEIRVLPLTSSSPGFAELVIGRRFAPTRWLNPGYMLERPMCVVATCLFLLLLVLGGGTAQAQTLPVPDCTTLFICKKVRIYNNNPTSDPTAILYVVFVRGSGGPTKPDDWLVALSQTTNANDKYLTSKDYRYYVNCCTGGIATDGIKPGHFAEITIPFYTQLVDPANGQTTDGYADWFNGNRVYFYDVYDEVSTNFNNDNPAKKVTPPASATVPCVTMDGVGACDKVTIFGSTTGLPDDNHAQLMEYTFTAAITNAQRILPFPLQTTPVGYNISYVDQVYLPVAMQPLNNAIPFIGTISTSIADFRNAMNQFLVDYPQWPVYRIPLSATGANYDYQSRPRIPGPNVIFNQLINSKDSANRLLYFPGSSQANFAFPDPIKPNDPCLTTQTCPTVSAMRDILYPVCGGTPRSVTGLPAYCQPDPNLGKDILGNSGVSSYKYVIDFFMKNYNDYLANCPDENPPRPKTPEPNRFLAQMYGWVPFDTTCSGANGLLQVTAGNNDDIFHFNQGVYIGHSPPLLPGSIGLQYPPDANNPKGNVYDFNPYTRLIHSQTYLNMRSAYAFSVDDAFGFLQFPADGLDLIYGTNTTTPCTGLNPCIPLNQKNKVVVTLGVRHESTAQSPVQEWKDFNPCGQVTKPVPFELGGNGAEIYPPLNTLDPGTLNYNPPCQFTATDTRGKVYRVDIVHAPFDPTTGQPTTGATRNCDNVTPLQIQLWCKASQQQLHVGQDPLNFLAGINGTQVIPDTNTHDFNCCQANDARYSDVLFRAANGDVQYWLIINGTNNAGPGSGAGSIGNVPNEWTIVGQGDFNGDGRGDILWRCAASCPSGQPNQIAMWFLAGDPNGSTAGLIGGGAVGTATTDWVVAGTGDFNGDHFSDILWYNVGPGADTGKVVVWLQKGTVTQAGSSLVICPELPPPSFCPAMKASDGWSVAGTGDFNADGKGDILWYNSNTGKAVIWYLNGATRLGVGDICCLFNPWQIVATGDFDNDNKYDILWQNTATGALRVWTVNGMLPQPLNLFRGSTTLFKDVVIGFPQNDGTVGTAQDASSPNWTVVQTGDFNADHFSDLLLCKTSTGAVAFWTMGLSVPALDPKVISVTTNAVPACNIIQGMNSAANTAP